MNSITEMKKYYTETHPDDERYLDVFQNELVMSKYKRKNTHYFMGLLSFAAVNGRKEFVQTLLAEGASKNMRLT